MPVIQQFNLGASGSSFNWAQVIAGCITAAATILTALYTVKKAFRQIEERNRIEIQTKRFHELQDAYVRWVTSVDLAIRSTDPLLKAAVQEGEAERALNAGAPGDPAHVQAAKEAKAARIAAETTRQRLIEDSVLHAKKIHMLERSELRYATLRKHARTINEFVLGKNMQGWIESVQKDHLTYKNGVYSDFERQYRLHMRLNRRFQSLHVKRWMVEDERNIHQNSSDGRSTFVVNFNRKCDCCKDCPNRCVSCTNHDKKAR